MSDLHRFDFVLFDLDGTLFDSAPDLVAAANRLRLRRAMNALPFDTLRSHAGRGARGLIDTALGITPEQETYPALQKEFLDDYQEHCCENSTLFNKVPETLEQLNRMGISWGIVTNKHARFTIPICKQCGLAKNAKVIISGDETGRLKPAPDNLLVALQKSGFAAQGTLYVGDDLRDAQAARAAGMHFAAVAYGYLGLASDISTWDADFILETPQALLDIFETF